MGNTADVRHCVCGTAHGIAMFLASALNRESHSRKYKKWRVILGGIHLLRALARNMAPMTNIEYGTARKYKKSD